MKQKINISRNKMMAENIVIVDGQPGCGKSMMSPIVSSFKRVELLTYIFEIEWLCRLFSFKKISKDAAISLIRMLIDHKIYQQMMGRETNFRISDVSSIFNYHSPEKYIKRIFQPGDTVIPNRIKKEKPILHLMMHDMMSSGDLLFESLGSRLVFIEIVRHPLYMLIQQSLNFKNTFNTVRDVEIYFSHNKQEFPYFVKGWEKEYHKINHVEKAIAAINHHTLESNIKRKKILKNKKNKLITIPFEIFVKKPDKYLNKIKKLLGTSFTQKTKKILKEQNIPRLKIADSIPLDIYKRCGWLPSDPNLSEDDELKIRRNYATDNRVSSKYIKILDKLSQMYEYEFLNN